MNLKQLLAGKKDTLIEQWTALVHGTYPFGTIGFLRTQQNPFVNPVGQRTVVAAAAFVGSLLAGKNDREKPDLEALGKVMDEFIRVRAIQDFSAQDAVAVIFALKQVLRDNLRETLAKADAAGQAALLLELAALESDVDALALMAFNSYAKHRELLAELRIKEFKRRHSQIIRQAERIMEQKFPEHKL